VEKTIQFKKENNNEISLQDQIVVQQLAKKKHEDVIDIGEHSQGRRATGLTIHGILLMAAVTSMWMQAFFEDACAPGVQIYNEKKIKIRKGTSKQNHFNLPIRLVWHHNHLLCRGRKRSMCLGSTFQMRTTSSTFGTSSTATEHQGHRVNSIGRC
jgi:hypothetical protein